MRKLKWTEPTLSEPVPVDVLILAQLDTHEHVVCTVDDHGYLWQDGLRGSVGIATVDDIVLYVELEDVIDRIGGLE